VFITLNWIRDFAAIPDVPLLISCSLEVIRFHRYEIIHGRSKPKKNMDIIG
jgi:hypothetical protein